MLFFGSPAQTALRISKILTLPWARMDNPASGLMMEHPAAPVAARLVLVRSGMIISAKRLSIGLTGLSSVIGLKLTASHGLGGSNFIDTGGAIVDPGGAATMVLIDGGTASISAITLANTYIETHNGETGEIVHINNGRNINLDGVFFNRGGATASNCISIQGTNAGQVRAYGRASGGGTPVCTTLIDNTITGYTLAPTGDFDYYYPGSASRRRPGRRRSSRPGPRCGGRREQGDHRLGVLPGDPRGGQAEGGDRPPRFRLGDDGVRGERQAFQGAAAGIGLGGGGHDADEVGERQHPLDGGPDQGGAGVVEGQRVLGDPHP